MQSPPVAFRIGDLVRWHWGLAQPFLRQLDAALRAPEPSFMNYPPGAIYFFPRFSARQPVDLPCFRPYPRSTFCAPTNSPKRPAAPPLATARWTSHAIFEVSQPRVSEAFRGKNTELALRILALFGQPYAGPFYVSEPLIGRPR